MRKKILIFIQNGVGGAERMSVLIGKSFDVKKYDVVFVVVESISESSITDFIPSNFRILKIRNINQLLLVCNMCFLLLKEKPDIVFSSVINLNNKILLLKAFFRKIRIVIRCDNYLFTYSKIQQKVIKILYPKADCIITQTKEMQNELLTLNNFNKNKIVTLLNPIDTQTIESKLEKCGNPYANSNLKHIVAVGRFCNQKGFDLLMQAFVLLTAERKDIDLTIVGDFSCDGGCLKKKLIEIATKAKLLNKFHCVGYTANPYGYIKYADCYVLSSRWEGLPNVLLESLYLGTPVAAFKCIPIIERILKEGINGYCAGKENVNELAKAISKTIELGRVETSYKHASLKDFHNILLGFDKHNND